MSSVNSIVPDKLARLIGTPKCPALLDVRADDEFSADPRLVPSSVRRSSGTADEWAAEFRGRTAVVICSNGLKISHGVAALLRDCGASAEVLEGGFGAWAQGGLPLVPASKLPPRNRQGRTVWVTRERPKIDRIACPWLIRRFVDPAALFLFVAPSEVEGVAEQFEGAVRHRRGVLEPPRRNLHLRRDDRGTGARFPALVRLAAIVRGADTARLDLAPEAPGLLAASLGLSRMYADDLEQLEAGMALYDAFYRWSRDATSETHNWPSNKKGA